MAHVVLGVVIGFVGGWVLGWIGGRLVGVSEGVHRERLRHRERPQRRAISARGVNLDQDSMAEWSDPRGLRIGHASKWMLTNTDTHGLNSRVVHSTTVGGGGGWSAGGGR